jgi:hypothetical protein
MKRTNTLCVLILLLVTINSAYAQVTDGGVTAYRYDINHKVVIFTDNPSDSPSSSDGPLGAGWLNGIKCDATTGTAGTNGSACNGTSGDPVSTYTCDLTFAPNATNTTWCLFSENPRTGDKAWAVKFVDGLIPENNGTFIVRCEGTDIFDSENGCRQPPSQISIEGGYIKLDTTDSNAPLDADCSETAHNGRMVFDETTELLYICAESGWVATLLTN